MSSDLLLQLREEETRCFELIEPADKRWTAADEEERRTREALHEIKVRFHRVSRAIRVLEGKE